MRTRAIAVVFLGLSLAFSACGGATLGGSATAGGSSSPGSSGTASGSSSPSGSATGGTIKIGVMGPFTGTEGYVGQGLLTGVKAAVAQINDAGGVLGKQLTFFTVDDTADPAQAVPAYRKMLAVDKPDLIVGPFSWTNGAVLPLVGTTQVPDFMQGGMTELNEVTNPFFWRPYPSDTTQGLAHGKYALSQGYKTAAFAYATTASAQTLEPPTKAAFEAGGGTFVANVQIVPNATSYRSAILTLAQAKPDVVFWEMDPQTAGTFFRQASQLGLYTKTQWVGTDTDYSIEVFKALGASLATTNLVVSNGALQGGPSGDLYNQWNKTANNLSTPGIAAPFGYDAVIAAALAMEAAKSTSGAVYNDKIRSVANSPGTEVYGFVDGQKLLAQGKDIDFEGAGTTVDFNQFNNAVGDWGFYAFTQSGEFRQVKVISATQP